MNREKIEYKIRKSIGRERAVNVTLRGSTDTVSLIPLSLFNGILLAASEVSFRLDGYMVIPLDRIERAQVNKDEGYNEILKKERVVEDINPPKLDMTSISSVCGYFLRSKECISLDIDGGFMVGKVTEIKKKGIKFKPFEAPGKWGKSVKIRFEDIRDVTFGDMYTRVYAKYTGK
ncbi:MAG: hypothetical protein K2N72_13335 [Oscillospiraceae bacterium]|nr:hypothetical protein [Oscillospiraceae bacterium]